LVANNLDDAAKAVDAFEPSLTVSETLVSGLFNPERAPLAQSIVENIIGYRDRFSTVVSLVGEQNEIYQNSLDIIGPSILTRYNEIFQSVAATQEDLGADAARAMRDVQRSSVIIGLSITAFAILFSILVSRSIRRQLSSITDQMNKLSQGDKSFDIAGVETRDEIGDMARALSVFRDNALEIEHLQQEQARLAAQSAQERRQTTMALAEQFEDRLGGILQTVETAAASMRTMTTRLGDAVAQAQTQSADVSVASSQADGNVQTVAAAAEEMSASIREIMQNVSDTARTAKTCAETAGRSDNDLKALGAAVEEIDDVLKSISDVAEQTNLLALNATIEAARAGEAGKGFAVVASEVKSLASETRGMTEEISNKVHSIKAGAQDTISGVRRIIDQIADVESRTASVASAIEQQQATTVEISRSVQEAARSTDQVAQGISAVKVASESSASASDELQGAADDVARQAASLKSAVQTFLTEIRA